MVVVASVVVPEVPENTAMADPLKTTLPGANVGVAKVVPPLTQLLAVVFQVPVPPRPAADPLVSHQ